MLQRVALRGPAPGEWVPNGDPGFIKKNIEGSLKRLKVTTIDLWQLHRIDPMVPVEKNTGARSEGSTGRKDQICGIIRVSIEQVEQVEKILPVVSVQNLYNLGNRKWEALVDYTNEKGMAFIPGIHWPPDQKLLLIRSAALLQNITLR